MSNATPSLEVVPSDRYGLSRIVERAADPVSALEKSANWFARSGLFGCDRLEQGAILVLTCLAEGLSPVEFSRTYDIISGKLRKKSAAAFAEFRQRGGKVQWIKTGDDGLEASAAFTWEGQTVTLSYSIVQARLANLVKKDSNWEKTPSNMLRARLISNAVGMLAPEIFAGEYEDIPSTPTTQPAAVALDLGKPVATLPTTTTAPPATQAPEAKDDVPMSYPPTQQQAQPVAPVAPGPLSGELQEQLITLITTERLPAAIKFVRSLKWIGPDDLLDALSEKHARQILAKGESFLAKLEGAK